MVCLEAGGLEPGPGTWKPTRMHTVQHFCTRSFQPPYCRRLAPKPAIVLAMVYLQQRSSGKSTIQIISSSAAVEPLSLGFYACADSKGQACCLDLLACRTVGITLKCTLLHSQSNPSKAVSRGPRSVDSCSTLKHVEMAQSTEFLVYEMLATSVVSMLLVRRL